MQISKSLKHKETVKQFFATLGQENIPCFVEFFAENGQQVNPYASGIFPAGAKGHKELLDYWTPVPGNFDGLKFIIHELSALEDPSRIFAHYTGRIALKQQAGHYENE